jgi:Fur family ferric uptake transcriptional regulator
MTHTAFQRNTPQRKVILEELQRTTSHPTAGELHQIVRRRVPKISLGTVYRNLDLLAEAGKIQKLDLGGSEARFDAKTDAHYHVRCVRCGRVDDVPGLPADLVGDELARAAGYEMLGHRLEFVGICPQCKTK